MTKDKDFRGLIEKLAQKHAEDISREPLQDKSRIAFVENKHVDMEFVADLLSRCSDVNRWANRGPLYRTLADAYHAHMNLADDIAVTPCANGGMALEAIARFHEIKLGKPIQWVGSAFSFLNLGRGWFTGMHMLDCDKHGMLDLEALAALDPASYDGFVVTNIFGLWQDFQPYIDFALSSGKAMLIDNAAGIDRQIPDWPYQSFSLHHTKPYGAGEGGLFTSPRDEAEKIYVLLNYGEVDAGNRAYWLNNGKLSDIACAFHLDRLARYHEWAPLYREQAERIDRIAREAGLKPLVPGSLDRPATSRPYLVDREIPMERLLEPGSVVFGKYYKPLKRLPNTYKVFHDVINIPTHIHMKEATENMLTTEIRKLLR